MGPIRITIWSLKGGVGKTTIAVNTAFEFGAGIVTNEVYTLLDKVIGEDDFIKIPPNGLAPAIPEDVSVVFDMGGYIDRTVRDACEQSNHIIIPTTNDIFSLQGTISTIIELGNQVDKIVVIANRLKKKKDLTDIEETIKDKWDIPILPLKESSVLQRIGEGKQSINQRQMKGGLDGYVLKSIAGQLKNIYDLIRGEV